jgi:hypothetical protein
MRNEVVEHIVELHGHKRKENAAYEKELVRNK